jgi:hypothetical protein
VFNREVRSLKVLRLLFLMAFVGCLTMAAARAQWEGQFVVGNHTWLIHLPRAPIWSPPDVPTYSEFQGFPDLPPASTPDLTIRRVLKWDWTIVELLLSVWGITVLFSAAYIVWRGERRDFLFHSILGAAIGMTSGAVLCLGVWLLCGGWAPPAPELFGLAGLVVGLFGALLDWAVGKVS